jgi:hypothetical protein
MLTCSYEEEATAMDLALDWTEEHCSSENSILICTDSQSLCLALGGHNPGVDELRSRISQTDSHVTVQWIPGHSEIAGNELADAAAKEATSLDELPGAISYGSICAHINAVIKDTEKHLRTKNKEVHERTLSVYKNLSQKKEKLITTRKDQVLLARIRSGHLMAFRWYQHFINKIDDPGCMECGAAVQDMPHWLQSCPATLAARQRYFGDTTVDLGILTSDPVAVLAFARATLDLSN